MITMDDIEVMTHQDAQDWVFEHADEMGQLPTKTLDALLEKSNP